MKQTKTFPKLFVSLDIDSQSPKVDQILETLKTKPEIGLKIHSVLDQWALEGNLRDNLSNLGHVWYDAKLADIPSTVALRIKNYAPIVDSITLQLHATGLEGANAAAEARDEIYKQTGKYLNLIGVTVMTSIDPVKYSLEYGIKTDLSVKNLIQVAIDSGLDAVVCSPYEASFAKKIIGLSGKDIKVITPGIKPVWAVANKTQVRVATPAKTIAEGSDSLVVGTAIVKADKPIEAINKILQEIEGVSYDKAEDKLSLSQKIACLKPLDIFKEVKAVYYIDEQKRKQGTWCRLTSGLLSPFYVNIGGVIDSNPEILSRIGQDIAKKIRSLSLQPELTVGAMMGSVRLSTYAANFLGVKSIYLEKQASDKKAHETEFSLKRHKVQAGQKVVIVEDLIAKGTTLKQMVKVLKIAGADILGIFLTINRSGITEIDGIKIHALQDMEPYAISQAEFDQQFPEAKICEKPKNEWTNLIK